MNESPSIPTDASPTGAAHEATQPAASLPEVLDAVRRVSARIDASPNRRHTPVLPRFQAADGRLLKQGEERVFDRERGAPRTLRWLTDDVAQQAARRWLEAAAWLRPLNIGGLGLPDEHGVDGETPYLSYVDLPPHTWSHLRAAAVPFIADCALGLLETLEQLRHQPWCATSLAPSTLRVTDDGRVVLCDLTIHEALPSDVQHHRVISLLRSVLPPIHALQGPGRHLQDVLDHPNPSEEALRHALSRCVSHPEPPWLGDPAIIDKSTDSLCSGRSIRVLAPPGRGGSRLVREVAARLTQQGLRWWALQARPGPYASLQPLVAPPLLPTDPHAAYETALSVLRELRSGVLLLDGFESFDPASRRALLQANLTSLAVVRRGPADLTLAPLRADDLQPLMHHDAGCLGHVEADTARHLASVSGGSPKLMFRRLAALRRAGRLRWEAGRLHLQCAPSRFAPLHALAPSTSHPSIASAEQYVDALIAQLKAQHREGRLDDVADLAMKGASLAAVAGVQPAVQLCLAYACLAGLESGRIDVIRQCAAQAMSLGQTGIAHFATVSAGILSDAPGAANACALERIKGLPGRLARWIPVVAAFALRRHPSEFGRRLLHLSMRLFPHDDRLPVVLSMMARLRREQGHLVEARELLLHASALPRLRQPDRVRLALRAAFLRLEQGVPVTDTEADRLVDASTRLRQPRLEAMAQLLRCRARYARGHAVALGPELLRSICVLSEPDLEAASLIHEGAVCWREGSALRARLCVLAAEVRAERARRHDMVALAGALWFLASTNPDHERRRRLRLALAHPLPVAVVVEVFAMLILAGQPLDEVETARFQAAHATLEPTTGWRQVLSQTQIQDAAERSSAVLGHQASGTQQNNAEALDLPETS